MKTIERFLNEMVDEQKLFVIATDPNKQSYFVVSTSKEDRSSFKTSHRHRRTRSTYYRYYILAPFVGKFKKSFGFGGEDVKKELKDISKLKQFNGWTFEIKEVSMPRVGRQPNKTYKDFILRLYASIEDQIPVDGWITPSSLQIPANFDDEYQTKFSPRVYQSGPAFTYSGEWNLSDWSERKVNATLAMDKMGLVNVQKRNGRFYVQKLKTIEDLLDSDNKKDREIGVAISTTYF